MRLALRRPVLHQLLRIQLAPMHLRTGKGPAGTLNANGSLDHFKPQTGIYHPLYHAIVVAGRGLPSHIRTMKTFIATSATLWSSTNCFSWSLRGIGCSAPAYWDQNNFFVELPYSAR